MNSMESMSPDLQPAQPDFARSMSVIPVDAASQQPERQPQPPEGRMTRLAHAIGRGAANLAATAWNRLTAPTHPAYKLAQDMAASGGYADLEQIRRAQNPLRPDNAGGEQ